MRNLNVIAIAAALTTATIPLAAQDVCSSCSKLASVSFDTHPRLGDWAASLPASPADKDAWHFTVAPYLLIATMSGTTAIGRLPPVKVELDANQIFSHLRAGAMLYFEASKGPWSFALDGIYMDLKQNIVPDSSRLSGSVTMTQGVLEGFVFRHISKPIEVMVGGIGVHLQSTITATVAIADTIEKAKSLDEAWGAPVIGGRWTPLDEQHWHILLFADIGGLSGNNWTWQVLPSVGYRFASLFELALQYRALAANYSTGSGTDTFKYNIVNYGPEVAFLFHF
jgi:hypothetical protein